MSYRLRFVAAVSTATLSAVACVATLIEPQWFERLFDESPDGGDGSLETIVAVLASLAACVLFAFLARREWRRGRQHDAAAGTVAAKGRT